MSTLFTQLKMRVFLLAASIAVLIGAMSASPAHAGVLVRVSLGHEWGHGHWSHDRHHGRLGWWWVVGPQWYYYERPHTFIVQQPAQPVVIQQAPPVVYQAPPAPVSPPPPLPPSPVLYYCKATGTHYPETMTCPGGWTTRTAETPPLPTNTQPPTTAQPPTSKVEVQDLGPNQAPSQEQE